MAEKPDPSVLVWFTHPRSQTDVTKLSGWWGSTVRKHMRRARSMGLIHKVGTKPGEYRGPRQTLYELTGAGVEYLEAFDDSQ